MKFINTIKSSATLKKKKYHDFDFSDEDVKKGMESKYDSPHIICHSASRVTCLYKDHNGNLAFNYFVSFYGFDKHNEEENVKTKKSN